MLVEHQSGEDKKDDTRAPRDGARDRRCEQPPPRRQCRPGDRALPGNVDHHERRGKGEKLKGHVGAPGVHEVGKEREKDNDHLGVQEIGEQGVAARLGAADRDRDAESQPAAAPQALDAQPSQIGCACDPRPP